MENIAREPVELVELTDEDLDVVAGGADVNAQFGGSATIRAPSVFSLGGTTSEIIAAYAAINV